MKIRKFFVNSQDEVIVKVTKEILNLFKIVIDDDQPEYELFAVANEQLDSKFAVRLRTVLTLEKVDGTAKDYAIESIGKHDEKEKASLHRLVKLNLYLILRKYCGMKAAPWGILHGVRPTKIVHRFLAAGLEREAVVKRLISDYEVSEEKATYLTDLAIRQLPFLAQSNNKLISVYVGIPYCLSRCLYCSFPAYVLPTTEKLKIFMASLTMDLQSAKEAIKKYGFKIQSIYVGGGTPTSLPNEYFDCMLHMVYDNFYDDNVVEFTVEAGRPDSMSPEKIKTMKACHVSRVSVNPQTMQEKTLRRIGRSHTPEDIIKMYNDLRKAGVSQINMDLILGLPGETISDVENTMQQLAELKPDDITIHSLALKRGSMLKMQLEDYELPDDETTQGMFGVAMRYIANWGLRPYYLYRQGYQSGQLENVGCCRDGAESIYNIQIMEERQTIIGIGASATTKVVFPETGRLKAVFTPKELSIYLRDTGIYIEKRAKLLAEAYDE